VTFSIYAIFLSLKTFQGLKSKVDAPTGETDASVGVQMLSVSGDERVTTAGGVQTSVIMASVGQLLKASTAIVDVVY